MNIREFIQLEILSRLRANSVLVVYDSEHRYRDLCLKLATAGRIVIDAVDSSIESREAAQSVLQQLGKPNTPLEGVLIYVPAKAPLTDEERQRDPFAIYGECGAVFPDPTNDGDDFQTLCLKAKPDQAMQVRRIFTDNPSPSFDVIDAIGTGAGWPHLRALLVADSAVDILFALLVPSERQAEALAKQDTWIGEAKSLFQSTLGLKLTSRGKSWSAIGDEFWRFLLYSEFVLDLPGGLPDMLANVPSANMEAWPLVEHLCERLRNDQRTQGQYIERAESIERELKLPELCRSIQDLGVRDTFPFEERTFFAQAIGAFNTDDIDRLHAVLVRHTESVWVQRGENQAQWQIVEAARNLAQAIDEAEGQFADHVKTQDSLLDFYISNMRAVDRRHREFEQARADYIDHDGMLTELTARARSRYRKLADQVQSVFVCHLEASGWPPAGRQANADMFDRFVAPLLRESGRRVALLLIDALRYELGVELSKVLAESDLAETHPAFAQLPSITPIGMASLLPGAGEGLKLQRSETKVVPMLADQPIATVVHRMDLLRARFGQRFSECPLNEFVEGSFVPPSDADLFVIRSNEMDSDFENNPGAAPGLIIRTTRRIAAAVRKLRDLGFQDAVIATDHGFYMNTGAGPGDVATKPPGNWLSLHDRMLLGDGTGDASNAVIGADRLGIRGDFKQIAIPYVMIPYRAGLGYFHGGASLQEAVVPIITVRLQVRTENKIPIVTLSYKRSSGKITTRLPVVEIAVDAGEMFGASAFDILLEAQKRGGDVVGEAKPGGPVNPATRTITLRPGDTYQVALRMDDDFEGKFTVKALDPTTMTMHAKLDLETDYTV